MTIAPDPVSRTTRDDRRSHFLSSELSRNPASVFAAAERRPVEVARRDGEDLVLMSKREATEREQLLEIAAQLIAVATDTDGTLTERMADRFPWMLALNAEDRDRCARELLRAARASFSTSQAHLAIATFTAWKGTAEAVAAGVPRAVEWLDQPLPVARP